MTPFTIRNQRFSPDFIEELMIFLWKTSFLPFIYFSDAPAVAFRA